MTSTPPSPERPMPSDRYASHRVRRQKVLNVPLLIGSLVFVLVAGVGGYFWHGRQVHRTASIFLKKADLSEADDRWFAAAQEIQYYLYLRPTDDAARIRLAKVYLKSARVAEAAGERRAGDLAARAASYLSQAIGVAGDDVKRDLRRELAPLLLQLGRDSEADRTARELLGGDPHDVVALKTVAISHFRQAKQGNGSEPGQIAEELLRALEVAPDDLELTELWLHALRRQPGYFDSVLEQAKFATADSRQATADEWVSEFLARNSSNPLAHLLRYRYRSEWKLDGAEDDLVHAVNLVSDNPAVPLVAARHFLAKAETARREGADLATFQPHAEQALGYFEQAIQVEPKLTQAYLGIGLAHLLLGDVDKAIDEWKRGLKEVGEDNIDLNNLLGRHLTLKGRVDEAEQALGRAERQFQKLGTRVQITPNDKLRITQEQQLAQARLLVKRAEFRRAIPMLQGLRVNPQSPELAGDAAFLLGVCHEQLRAWDQAAHIFEELSQSNADSDSLRRRAALAWEQFGHQDESLRQLERLRKPEVDDLYKVAWIRLRQELARPQDVRDFDRFKLALENLVVRDRQSTVPWRSEILEQLASVLLKASDERPAAIPAAGERLVALQSRIGGDPAAKLELLAAFNALGLGQQSEHLLEQLEQSAGTSSERLARQLQLRLQKRDFEGARKVIAAAVLEQPQEPGPRMMMIQVAMLPDVNDVSGALEQFARLRDLKLSEDQVQRLAHAAIEIDLGEAEFWEQRLREMQGAENTEWRLVRALRLLADHQKNRRRSSLDESFQIADELCSRRASWAAAHLLRGLVLEARGEFEPAVQALETVVSLGDRRPVVYERLLPLLLRLGRLSQARELLASIGDAIYLSDRLQAGALGVLASSNDIDSAMTTAERAATMRPTDAEAQVRLAHVLMLKGDAAGAEQRFQQALSLDKRNIGAWNGLFTLYVRSRDLARARSTLNQLSLELTGATRAIVLAQGHYVLGDSDEAEQFFAQAQEAAGANISILQQLSYHYRRTDPAKAQELLERILQIESGNRWARRALAELLANQGESAWPRIEQLLDLSNDAGSDSQQDRRMRVLLLIQRSRRVVGASQQSLRDAQKISEELARSSREDVDKVILGGIYALQARLADTREQRDAKIKAAREVMERLCSRDDAKVDHLYLYVDFLLGAQLSERPEDRKWADVENWLGKLKAAAPTALTTLRIEVELYRQQGRLSEIETAVEGLARRLLEAPDLTDAKKLEIQVAAANIFSQVGLYEQAEAWHRKLFEQDPRFYSLLASTLMKQGKTTAAVELCLQFTRDAETARPAAVLASVLAAGQPSPMDLALADDVLTRALARYPEDVDLLFSIGNVRLIQERVDEAARLFESVLKTQPRNAVAMNNLAMALVDIQGRAAQAYTLAERAAETASNSVLLDTLDTKGSILVKQQRYAEALEVLNHVVDSPARPDPRYVLHLAFALYKLNRVPEAREMYDRAMRDGLLNELLTVGDKQQQGELEYQLRGTARR